MRSFTLDGPYAQSGLKGAQYYTGTNCRPAGDLLVTQMLARRALSSKLLIPAAPEGIRTPTTWFEDSGSYWDFNPISALQRPHDSETCYAMRQTVPKSIAELRFSYVSVPYDPSAILWHCRVGSAQHRSQFQRPKQSNKKGGFRPKCRRS